MPSQLVNESRTDRTAGTQTNVRWMAAGMPTMIHRTILSRRVSRRPRLRRRGLLVAAGAVFSTVVVMVQLAKIVSFCFWMDFVRLSTSFGFFRKAWIEGIITVDAKSGRVSRSMNCAMFLVLAMSTAAFFWTAVYLEVSAVLFAATSLESVARYVSAALADPRNLSRALAPSSFFGDLAIMNPSIGASMESTPCSVLMAGNGKKSTSSLAVVSCWPTKDPRRYIPDFFWSRLVAASCQVAP